MSLPLTNQSNDISFNNIKTISGVNIRLRNYKISDIENYLKRVKKKDNENVLQKATYSLLKSCVHPEDITKLENLDRINIIYLIIHLRLNSVSGMIPFPHECIYCKTVNFEHKINILPLDVEYEDNKEIVFSEDFSIGLQNIPFSKELELIEIEDEDVRADFEFYYKIRYIQNKDVLYEAKSFTMEELKEWFSCSPDEFHLSSSQYIELITKLNEYTNKEYIKINQKSNCVACGKELNLIMNNFTFFIMA
jgi:hypothetical protein